MSDATEKTGATANVEEFTPAAPGVSGRRARLARRAAPHDSLVRTTEGMHARWDVKGQIASLSASERAEFDATRAARLFGEAVYSLRTAKGWSQRQLADAAGMKQQSISRIEESASSLPTLAVVAKLAKALDADASVTVRTRENEGFEFVLTPHAA